MVSKLMASSADAIDRHTTQNHPIKALSKDFKTLLNAS